MSEVDWLGSSGGDHQVQRSDEWYRFRQRHIGASEVPILMGESDWSSVYELWQKKTGAIQEKKETTWYQQRGIDAEPKIKELYERRTGFKTIDRVIEYECWPVLSASLDGWVEAEKIVVEFKCPSKKKHEMAKNGEVPLCYRAQVQAQMLVSKAIKCHYVSFDIASDEIAIVTVEPNQEYQQRILERAKWFWEFVDKKIAPPFETGALSPNDLAEIEEYLDLFHGCKKQIALIEKRAEEYRKIIESKVTVENAKIGKHSVAWITRRGSVDYSKVEELKGVDLEKYRKPETRFFKIYGESDE